MTLPLSTPGKCCGHNLNMHTGAGLEGVCVICSCVGFEPDACYYGHAKGCEHMAISPDELRQCRAELHSPEVGNLRCQGEVTDRTTHVGDHWAYADQHGNKVYWTNAVAIYPIANPDRTQVGNGSARLDQVGGEHYKKFKIQPWDVIDEYDLSFYAGNALKYLLRAGHKGAKAEDLRKCRHYLDKLIEIEEASDGGS